MADEPPSSPPNANASPEEALAYYKAQYEQVELELTEFQTSSKELEDQLEQDVEASERRERQLKERIEGLGFEVDEWKAKYKQAKTEANSAQNTLQKEITTLRDASRNYQLRLRDTEVANDDFERQARNTSSSLEDLESKYSVAIERAVMLESEIHIGEKERENLRIETQRLRDELADLKIEAEITHDKLRHAETAAERHHTRMPHNISTLLHSPNSPISESSQGTTTSSPTLQTSPPPKSTSTGRTSAPTPPSPPISEASNHASSIPVTPDKVPPKSRLSLADSNTTPRPSNYSKLAPRHSRGPSIPVSNGRATPARRTTLQKSQLGQVQHTLPSSSSLRQIRGLIGQMQRLEQRVHSARSKLPGPVNTPPHASPRSGSALSSTPIPSNVTLRSGKRRTGGSNVSSIRADSEITPLSTQHVSRLSIGGPSADRSAHGSSRPSSRASTTSRSSISHSGFPQRPSSRASQSGARTPMGHYPTAGERRPRSSLGGTYGHSFSSSVNGGSQHSSTIEEKDLGFSTPTSRRNTLNKSEIGTGIPTPTGIPRRQSGGIGTVNLTMTPATRRTSSGMGRREDEGEMRPPSRLRKLSGVGETY